MAIYACKCDIPKSRLKEDMQAAFKVLKNVEHGNELTQVDVESALEAYSKEYYNFTIDDIEHLTAIRIERNKRNGRKRKQHLELARGIREVKGRMGEDVSGGGRPSVAAVVREYRQQHPDARKSECIRDTGLSKKTVYKWWNFVKR